MNFGEAIQALKDGKMVCRSGWNGKGVHLYLEDKFAYPVVGGIYAGVVREYEPVIVMFTAQKKHQPGWHPSTPDVLADDWQIVEL